VGEERQADVVVEPAPGAPLEVVQAQLLLELLVALFHRPAALPQTDGLLAAAAGRQVGKGELQFPVGLLLEQQPDPPGARPPPRRARARRAARQCAPRACPCCLAARSPCAAAPAWPTRSRPPAAGCPAPGGAASRGDRDPTRGGGSRPAAP